MKKKLLFLSFILTMNMGFAQNAGNALDFDGTNDYVTASLPTVFTNVANNDISVEAWIKPKANNFCRILFAQYSSSSFISLSISSTNEVYFYINNTVGIKTSSTLALNQWTHVACTWNASTQLAKIYINGVEETTISGGSSSTGTDNMLSIGSRTDGFQYFTGELDEIRIWNTVRTACDIEAYKNTEFDTTQANLIAYYPFNQGIAGGTNTTVTSLNEINNNYNGTLQNFALSGSSSNWLTSSAVINLTNQYGIFGIDSITECFSYTWIDGNTYTTSNNTASYTITGGSTNGCDSIVYLDLTINTVDTSTSLSGSTITSNATSATYQWLDCDNAMSIIPSETGQNFTPTANGNYAVEVTENACIDTSACVSIINVNISKNSTENSVAIYPNPTKNSFTVDCKNFNNSIYYSVYSMDGRLVAEGQSRKNNFTIDLSKENKAIYFLRIMYDKQSSIYKIVKE